MKRIISLAALLAAGLTAASGIGHVSHAYAQPSASQTVAVHYGDLDLASEAGRRALDHRIRHAVRTACGTASTVDLRGQNRAAECRSDLLASLAADRDTAFASASHVGGRTTLIARR